jgi:transcriptional regulator with XRE-family HTH domain
LSQERLAELSGLHRTYIGQLERGKKSPTVKTIFDIGKALGILPSELIKEIEKG